MDTNKNKGDDVKKEFENGDGVVVVGVLNSQNIGWGYRHQQCIVLFCCLTVSCSMRACMGVSLVAMTGETTLLNTTHTDNNITDVEDTEGFLKDLLFTAPYPTFQWSKKVQDTILASFFWGYMVLQIPAGLLAHRFGTRYLLTVSLMINCLMSFCLPWGAFYGGWVVVVIMRIVQGLSQSCIVPGMHTAFGKWAPLEERGRLTACAYGGQALGTVLGMPITGFIAASPLGWPGIFRFYGILSGITGGMVWWLAADSPAQHTSISAREQRYIEEALGQTEHKKPPLPWKRLLSSPGMYAIVVGHCGHTWGYLTLSTEVPAFMDKIMKVNIKANGLLTALPFFVMWVTNFLYSYISDVIIVKKILSVTHTRKLFNSIGCIPTAIGLVILAYVKKDIYIVESILVISCAFCVATNLGFRVNHIDISPNFAGTMMGISNFVANGFGSLAPIVAGFVLTDVSSEVLWRKVFFISAGVYVSTNLLYMIFGTSELANWNEPKKRKEDDENSVLRKIINNQ